MSPTVSKFVLAVFLNFSFLAILEIVSMALSALWRILAEGVKLSLATSGLEFRSGCKPFSLVLKKGIGSSSAK